MLNRPRSVACCLAVAVAMFLAGVAAGRITTREERAIATLIRSHVILEPIALSDGTKAYDVGIEFGRKNGGDLLRLVCELKNRAIFLTLAGDEVNDASVPWLLRMTNGVDGLRSLDVSNTGLSKDACAHLKRALQDRNPCIQFYDRYSQVKSIRGDRGTASAPGGPR